MRTLAVIAGLVLAGACTPYEAPPASPYQWQQRVERIEREHAERVERCRAMDRESARFARECADLGEID